MNIKRISKHAVIAVVTLIVISNITSCKTYQIDHETKTSQTLSSSETSTTPVPTATPKQKVKYEIKEVKHFCNGVAWVTAHNPENYDRKYIAVNSEGNVIFTSSESTEFIVHPQKGLTASPNTHGYTEIMAAGDGYYIVLKREESFEAVTNKVGCITSEGEVIMQPTLLPDGSDCEKVEYLGESCFAIIPHTSMDYDSSDAFLYNAVSNSWSSKYENLGDMRTPNELNYDRIKGAIINAEKDIVVDLSAYKEKIINAYVNEGYILLDLEGADKKSYYCVLNIDGTEIVSPTPFALPGATGATLSTMDNGYFMVIDYSHIKSIKVDGTVRADVDVGGYYIDPILRDGCVMLKYNGHQVNFINLDGEVLFPNDIIELEVELI